MFHSLGVDTPPLGAVKTGECGGFVPPHTQRFQVEIFNTPLLCGGDFLLQRLEAVDK
jgi:hypothetical protein